MSKAKKKRAETEAQSLKPTIRDWDGPIDSGPDSGMVYWHLVFGDFRLILRQLKNDPHYMWGNLYCGATPALEGLRIDSREVEAAKTELIEKAKRILNKAISELPK